MQFKVKKGSMIWLAGSRRLVDVRMKDGKLEKKLKGPFKKTSPLKGKTVVFLGSSVTKGFAAHNNAFAEYIAIKDSCICIKEAVNGTTLIVLYDSRSHGK